MAASSIDWTKGHEGKRASDEYIYNVMDRPFKSVHEFRRNGLSLPGSACVMEERMANRWSHINWNWDLVEYVPDVLTKLRAKANRLEQLHGSRFKFHAYGPETMREFLKSKAPRSSSSAWRQYDVVNFDWQGLHSEANMDCFRLLFEKNLLARGGFIINTSGMGHAQLKSEAHQACESHVTSSRIHVEDVRVNKWPLPEGARAKIHGFARLVEAISKSWKSPVKAVSATLYSSGKFNHTQIHHLFRRL